MTAVVVDLAAYRARRPRPAPAWHAAGLQLAIWSWAWTWAWTFTTWRNAMHAPASAAIRPGPGAGAPRPLNDLMLDRLTAAKRAVVALKREGYTVIDVRLAGCRPLIEVQNHPHLAELIESQRACYYIYRHGPCGPERVGQFELEGCRVIWTVKGN